MLLAPEQVKPRELRLKKPLSQKQLYTMANYLHVPAEGQRTIIWDAIDTKESGKITYQDPEVMHALWKSALQATKEKVEGVGLSLHDYFRAIKAFRGGNIRLLQRLARDSDEVIREERKKIETTVSRYSALDDKGKREYTPERTKKHKAIVEEALKGKEPQKEKTMYVLIAPIAAGKSTLRKNLIANPENVVNTDPDLIRPSLINNFNPQNNAQVQATHTESHDASDMLLDEAINRGLNIVYEGTGSNFADYKRDIKKCIDSKKGYKVELVFVANTIGECFRRAIAYRTDRGIPLSVVMNSAQGFENFHQLLLDQEITPSISYSLIADNSVLHQPPTKIFETQEGMTTINNRKAVRGWKEHYSKFCLGTRRGR